LQITDRLNNSRKLIVITDLLKISFIIFIAFSFIAQMTPYYYGLDSYVFGNTAINLANGTWGFSNELLKETGLSEFVPWMYVKTVQNEAIPVGANIGMHGMFTLSYIIGGLYGLFYIGPIFSILLIVAIDRICINLFGRFVAFIAVILTGTSWIIFEYGIQLYSENIFTFFFVIGIFFLIKFFRTRDEKLILLSSSFLVFSVFLRPNGIISFPLEIFLFIGFLFLPIISKIHLNFKSNTISNSFYPFNKNQKQILKNIFFMLIPWVFFFLVTTIKFQFIHQFHFTKTL